MAPSDTLGHESGNAPAQSFRRRFCDRVAETFVSFSNKYPEFRYSKKHDPADMRVLEELGLPDEGFQNATALVTKAGDFLMIAETADGEVVFRTKLGCHTETVIIDGIESSGTFPRWNRELGNMIRKFEKYTGAEPDTLYREVMHDDEYRKLVLVRSVSLKLVSGNTVPEASSIRTIINHVPGQPKLAHIIRLDL
jgi:hypothetical protein